MSIHSSLQDLSSASSYTFSPTNSDDEPESSSTTTASSLSTPPSLASPESDTPNILSLKHTFFDLFPNVPSPSSLPSAYPPIPSQTIPLLSDPKDKGTPDEWVKRDESLVRLTGKHPFNSEAKLDKLYKAGFLTPTELFYVRNHGAVPQVDVEKLASWRISIEGQVLTPLNLSINDLKARFQVVTIPVTLVCAGNRRKEQNVVRKGLGFSWGAGGVSTALFTGVYLADVLAAAQPTKDSSGRKAQHVIFEGIDDLPQGRYGTSQLLSWAKDRNKGMLISWAMNGMPLEPDHGFPVRIVIPGQIGGRSVKWVNKIEVSHQESQHYLHFWDNKLLPTQVMPEEARAEKKWWYDRKYLINELNTNSAIAVPDHGEVLDLASAETYTIQGYAYSGGGRRVNRIEVSLDEGITWKLAEIEYPEDRYREEEYEDALFGKFDLVDRDTCFCWCFFNYVVDMAELREAPALMVRAMDEGLSGQPRDMYWSATSMMNNWWFRVAVHAEGENSIRFEHPTMAGTQTGGWMERMKDQGHNILQPVFGKQNVGDVPVAPVKIVKKEVVMTKEGIKRMITMEELKAHSGHEAPWFVVAGEVYDGTGFLKDHPGGGDSITLVAGEDATEDFMSIHSPQGKTQLAQFHIGTLDISKLVKENKEDASGPIEIEPIFLNKTKWKKGILESVQVVSHDSRVYRFALEKPDQLLGLPTGQHVFIRLRRKVPSSSSPEVIEGELVQRAYTPVSAQDARGHIELLIKLYLPSADFPEGGKMTRGFDELVIGESIEFKGPLGSFVWQGKGLCSWRGKERKVRKMGLICAGSGITPILQVVRGVVWDKEDEVTEMWVIDANKTYEDILCREDLDELVRISAGRLRLHHTLSTLPPTSGDAAPSTPYTGSKGRITLDMMRNHLPSPEEDGLVLVCGPAGLQDGVIKPGLTELGWNIENQLVIF